MRFFPDIGPSKSIFQHHSCCVRHSLTYTSENWEGVVPRHYLPRCPLLTADFFSLVVMDSELMVRCGFPWSYWELNAPGPIGSLLSCSSRQPPPCPSSTA